MIDKVVLATRNKGKTKEFQGLLSSVIKDVISLDDLESPPDIIEDGDTFEENALKKARMIAEYSGMLTLADDSGLVVEALGGRPGVYSARFAGEGASDRDNITKLLKELGEGTNRRAKFVCVLALVFPDGTEIIAEGECPGEIMDKPRGEGGFGYDPVFYLPDREKTMAEVTPEIKNSISHRARAVKNLKEILSGRLK
jgi:XTP/dITP diphosphohydrolase